MPVPTERRLATSQPAPTAVRPAPGPTDDLAPPQVPAVSQTAPAADRSLPQSTATTSPASSLDATLDRSGVPPSARRRPTAIRPTSELRQAVAGAVARAAAQGPLLPKIPEGSADSTLQTSEPSPTSSECGPATSLFEEGPADLVAPLQPAAQHGPVVAPETLTSAGDHTGDPHEDFARLAGAHPLAGTAPRRRGNRPSVAPAGSRLSAVEASQPSPVQEATGAGGAPESPFAGSSSEAAQASEPHSPQPEPVQLEPALDATVPEVETPGTAAPELHFPGLSNTGAPSWPIGERRSFARQARKPLPAALQAVVASESAQGDPGEQASKPTSSGQPSEPADALLGREAVHTEAKRELERANMPGVIRRYASAIAIVVLFVAAAGAAAGIAALRGPVNHPGVPRATLKRAANNVALKNSDFPLTWHVSNDALTAGSYGFGSVFNSPAVVKSWLATHPSCATGLNDVRAGMTASDGETTAVAFTQATSSDPLGGSWQIADLVAFHSSSAQLRKDLATTRSALAAPGTRACIDRFWSAALLAGLPPGSSISLSVSQPPLPVLPGNPSTWVMAMGGTATVRNIALPFRFEVTSFAIGREQVSFVTSSKLAPLPLSLTQALLVVLATRAERQAS